MQTLLEAHTQTPPLQAGPGWVLLLQQLTDSMQVTCKKRKEKTTPFGVNLMRSQVLYQAAQ